MHWQAERWSDKNADDPNIIFSLTCRDGVFLCSGGGVGRGFILRSTDGKTWKSVVEQKWRIAGVLALDDRFLSIFDDHYQTSVDGIHWEPQAPAKPESPTLPGSGYLRRWTAGKGAVVFAGDYATPDGKPRVGWIGTSRNGSTPMQVQTEPADVRGLEFGNDRFIVVTATGDILRSLDGARFEKTGASGDEHDDNAVRFIAGRFYLVGRQHTWTSRDGDRWEIVAPTPHLPRAVSPTGVAVDCHWGGIDVAPDGKHFTKADVPVDATGTCAMIWAVPKE